MSSVGYLNFTFTTDRLTLISHACVVTYLLISEQRKLSEELPRAPYFAFFNRFKHTFHLTNNLQLNMRSRFEVLVPLMSGVHIFCALTLTSRVIGSRRFEGTNPFHLQEPRCQDKRVDFIETSGIETFLFSVTIQMTLNRR